MSSYFRVPAGNDIWDHFPAMGLSPELEGETGLFVVVYDGPVSGPFSGVPGVPREPPTDVLCVVTSDLEPNVYANVSRAGMALPAGAYIAPASTPR